MIAGHAHEDDHARNTERVVILMYHRVGTVANDWERRYCVTPEQFAAHMSALVRRGMRACTIHDFIEWRNGRLRLSPGAFVLTFDDGFKGVYEHAFPCLVSMAWPATVFLVSGQIGKTDHWTRSENPSNGAHPLLGVGEIREMARNGIAFHSHSRSHADLTTLAPGQLRDELEGARRDLEVLLGEPVPYLAYPYGRYNDAVLEATRNAGYEAAFSVQPGFNRRDVDSFRIRRLDIFGTDTTSMLLRKVKFGSNDGSMRRTIRYYRDRLAARLPGMGVD